MGASGPGLKVDLGYLFSGYIEKVDGAGMPVARAKSLRPVQRVTVLTRDTGRAREDGDLQTWRTDATGLLQPFRKGAARVYAQKQRFIMPPPEVLLQAWGAAQEDGPEVLAKLLKGQAGLQGVELIRQRVRKSQLSPPDRKSESQDEKDYAAFYDGISDGLVMSAFVLPKVRAVLIRATNQRVSDARVELYRPDGTAFREVVSPETQGAVFLAKSDTELPEGIYRIVVYPTRFTCLWHKATVEKGSYELKEPLRFPIRNFAGDFDVISCDPISVEEAIMLQYASLYPWHAAEAKRKALYPDMKPLVAGPKNATDALEVWLERAHWAHGKTAMMMKTAQGDLPGPRKLASAVYERLGMEEVPELKFAKEAVDLAFGVKDNLAEWKKVIHQLAPKFEKFSKLKMLEISRKMRNSDGLARATRNAVRAGLRVMDDTKTALAETAFSETKVMAERALAETFEKSAWSKAPKLVAAADLVLQIFDFVMLYMETEGSEHAFYEARDRFHDLAKQVGTDLDDKPCREAIANLELVRSQVELLGNSSSEQTRKAALAMLMMVVGLRGPVAKAAVEAVAFVADKIVMPAVEWIDRTYIEEDVGSMRAVREQAWSLYTSSRLNWSLLEDRLEHPREVQFRLRAELLGGLLALLTRASLGSADEQEYLQKVKEYKIGEYIEQCLLGDGWPLPATMRYVPIVRYWLLGKGRNEAPPEHRPAGFPPNVDPRSPEGAQLIARMRPEKLYRAAQAWQESYPIHTMEASSVEALARALRNVWPGLGEASIVHSCIYTRPRGSKSDADWQPLDKGGAKPGAEPRLSPLDPLRILIVLDEKVKEGIYALSVQLNRLDENIKGPVYKATLSILGPELLEKESGFKGRIGCVLVPFYEFEGELHHGAKPLVTRRHVENRDPIAVPPLGRRREAIPGGARAVFAREENRKMLQDMVYQFRVTLLGKTKVGLPVNLGRAGGKSAVDRFRVSFGDSSVETRMARDAAFLKYLGEDGVLPELFKKRSKDDLPLACELGGLYVRVGKRRYEMARYGHSVRFAEFDWNADVELVVSIWCREIARDVWEAQGLDWRSVPTDVQLVSKGRFTEVPGPAYETAMEYVGTLDPGMSPKLGPSTATLAADPEAEERWSDGVREWVRQLREPGRVYEYGTALQVGGDTGPGKGHLFAAHVRLRYVAPNGTSGSLRPFGHVHGTAEFQEVSVAVRTKHASGMDGTVFAEAQFQAPKDYTRNVPWAPAAAQKRDEKAFENIRKWIEDRPSAVDGTEAGLLGKVL